MRKQVRRDLLVRWTRQGVVRFYNETHLMASVPTSEHHALRTLEDLISDNIIISPNDN